MIRIKIPDSIWHRVWSGLATIVVLALGAAFFAHRTLEPTEPVTDAPKPVEQPAPVRPQPPQSIPKAVTRPKVQAVQPQYQAPPAPSARRVAPAKEHLPPNTFPPVERKVQDPPEPETPVTPPPAFIAERTARGVAQSIEIPSLEGPLLLVSADSERAMRSPCWVLSSQIIRTIEGGNCLLPKGPTVILASNAAVGLTWSQTHSCFCVNVIEGDILVSLGQNPTSIHVAYGNIAVLLLGCWGDLWLSATDSTLRITPVKSSFVFKKASQGSQMIGKETTLVLGLSEDQIEPMEQLSLASLFPRKIVKNQKPGAQNNPEPENEKPPPIEESLKFLADQGYRFNVTGKYLREGTWTGANGILISTIDEFTAARNGSDLLNVHVHRGDQAWDHIGSLYAGSREKRIYGIVRTVPPPHEELQRSFSAVRDESKQKPEFLREPALTTVRYVLHPERIQSDMATLIESAVSEVRMEHPSTIDWDTLRGTLEMSLTKDDSHKLIRAVDRRQVEYLRKGTPGVLFRYKYSLQTEYEFSEHGAPVIRGVPASILSQLGGK